MFTHNIRFENFKNKRKDKKISIFLSKLLKEDNEVLNSLKSNYINSYKTKDITKFKKFSNFLLIGMGGSILGARAIYSFLKKKIKKKFFFKDNFDLVKNNKKKLNLIISKSGNTLETIANANILIGRGEKNIFITENKKSYLSDLAKKLKAEIIHHNNFIGGRYSVLSEVGMLPAELMGLKISKFKKFNDLIKNKNFINSLVLNVSNIFNLIKKKRFNSIILNYDNDSSDLFHWYQQLVAESLGKKGRGLLPIISNMPKDNHSLMQFYLEGTKGSFYTFFINRDELSKKINNKTIQKTHSYLKNKNLSDVKFSQYLATKKVFNKKNIPFRSFEIYKKSEESLGELFTFFILETILLGKALGVNPYDQPAVELIKKDTTKILIKS